MENAVLNEFELSYQLIGPGISLSAIVLAANSHEISILHPLAASPIITHLLNKLQKNSDIHEIILLAERELIPSLQKLCSSYHISKLSAIKELEQNLKPSDSFMKGVGECDRLSTHYFLFTATQPLISETTIAEIIRAGQNQSIVCCAPESQFYQIMDEYHLPFLIESETCKQILNKINIQGNNLDFLALVSEKAHVLLVRSIECLNIQRKPDLEKAIAYIGKLS